MSLFLDDGDVRLYHGDALTVLQGLPAGSVHCCVTSPPFYGLRDYGTGRWEGGTATDCPDCTTREEQLRCKTCLGTGEIECAHSVGGQVQQTKAGTDPNAVGMRPGVDASRCRKCGARRVDQQIGLEETPEQWVANLVDVFREVRRVLRPEGTLWLEVGDSYASVGSGYREGEFLNPGGKPPVKQGPARNRDGAPMPPNCKPKDLIGAPWMLAFALRADGWYLRSDIVWARPNPMPESVTDRPTKSHSYVFLLSKQPRYFFDQEAVREPNQDAYVQAGGKRTLNADHHKIMRHEDKKMMRPQWGGDPTLTSESGRNVRSVWNIATQPFPDAHFATFPEELAKRCILAGTSERGCCPECGAPWERLVEVSGGLIGKGGWQDVGNPDDPLVHDKKGGHAEWNDYKRGTLGWRPSCACVTIDSETVPAPGSRGGVALSGFGLPLDPCVVLDPFVGSGTVPYVARKHGRHAIGIDLSRSYLELAARQLSLFAQVQP